MEPNLQNNIQAVQKQSEVSQKPQQNDVNVSLTNKTPQKVDENLVSNQDKHYQMNQNQVKIEIEEQSLSEIDEANDTSMINQNSNSASESTKKGGPNPNGQKPHREQKYKRSTNNSHKKFISVARRWMFKNNRSQLKGQFQTTFHGYKSTRTYFFIILAFIKNAMSQGKKQQFKAHFMKQIQQKIKQYQKQIQTTSNENLKHFRGDEITDLKFAIRAFTSYFQGDNQKAIQCVYKKDKATIVKKQHYDEALKTLNRVQKQFSQPAYRAKTIRTQQNDTGKRKPRVRKPKVKQLKLQQEIQKLMENQNFFYTPQMFGLKKDFSSMRRRAQKIMKSASEKKNQESNQQERKQLQDLVKFQDNYQQSRVYSQKKQRFAPVLLWNDYCSLNIKVLPNVVQKQRSKIKIQAQYKKNQHQQTCIKNQMKVDGSKANQKNLNIILNVKNQSQKQDQIQIYGEMKGQNIIEEISQSAKEKRDQLNCDYNNMQLKGIDNKFQDEKLNSQFDNDKVLK